tara:strand:+ start:668 stop:1528 length:861 start_codon:yes stop_codon:yes gene_type:complete
MQSTEKRNKLRKHLAGDICLQPASVFDPISARIASSLEFEFGMLGGSVASAIILGAPDINLITSTELADLVNRTTRASDISLIVDGDNGYGNALNVMRTINELEIAGASGITIEDTVLPAPFGGSAKEVLIHPDEMVKKLDAAISAREDPSTVIIGRTHAANATNMPDAIQRIKAYQDVDLDAIFLTGIKATDQLEQIAKISRLPLMLGNTPNQLSNDILSTYNVKIALRGHTAFTQSVIAIRNEYLSQIKSNNGLVSESKDSTDEEIMESALNSREQISRQKKFL